MAERELKHSLSENRNNCSGVFGYYIPGSEEEKPITLYFPSIVHMRIRNLIIPECFYEDNIHLTDYGNIVYGNKIAEEIKK